jgi:hypothetical protein
VKLSKLGRGEVVEGPPCRETRFRGKPNLPCSPPDGASPTSPERYMEINKSVHDVRKTSVKVINRQLLNKKRRSVAGSGRVQGWLQLRFHQYYLAVNKEVSHLGAAHTHHICCPFNKQFQRVALTKVASLFIH